MHLDCRPDAAKKVLSECQHLDEYLATPAVIPNVNRRRKELTKYFTQASTPKQPETLCEKFYSEINAFDYSRAHLSFTAEECALMRQSCFAGLDHRFAEGADLTLTDIVLFPCLSIILVNSIDFLF